MKAIKTKTMVIFLGECIKKAKKQSKQRLENRSSALETEVYKELDTLEKYAELGMATQWAFENDVECVVVNGILMIVKDGWYDESVVDYWRREVNND